MINLPTPLAKVMQSEDLAGLKPFAVLLRNKWYATEESASGIEESDSGSDTGGYFALDTDNPIDISGMIVKPNTLSMTLDVNEVAQYKANNVTLTLYDPFNRFIENTPLSYFPQGYQLYGSQVVVYYGLDETNRTPLFVGVIKELPTHKPEQYQVDLKLISPLELLRDKEAKEFSDKYYGEVLTLKEYDDNNNPVYQTSNAGVGGFNAVYANGQKMFEGVDYEIKQENILYLPALVTITNADLYSAEITADYYCWKTNLSVEQVVSGLVALAGYTENIDIRNVLWNTAVTSQHSCSILGTFGFKKDNTSFTSYYYRHYNRYGGLNYIQTEVAFYAPNFKLTIGMPLNFQISSNSLISNWVQNGFEFSMVDNGQAIYVYQNYNIINTINLPFIYNGKLSIEKNNNEYTFTLFDAQGTPQQTQTIVFNEELSYLCFSADDAPENDNFSFTFRNNLNEDIYTKTFTTNAVNDSFLLTNISNFNNNTLKTYKASIQSEMLADTYYRVANNYNVFNEWQQFSLGGDIGQEGNYFQMMINFPFATKFNDFSQQTTQGNEIITYIKDYLIPENEIFIYLLASSLLLEFVNLSGKSLLEALEDFALISGYEFGIDRQGTFFFRPRGQSTTPIYDLDKNEIVKIDNVQKRFNDFFTKLTLTFAERPLEFYANTGARPTPVDRYGVINKEIDKPEIVNYDNPELAQAIGPQLLSIYSNLADIIQLTGKLNLNLELGDVVNVKRNYNLTNPETASDTTKFNNQNTYFRACKITGLNYNFAKKQITYTLRSVSNENNQPQYEFDEFIYDFQVPLGVKE